MIARGQNSRVKIEEIFEIRRNALQRLIDQYESTAGFCRKFNQDDSRIRHLLNGQRNFAEKAARQLEEDCGLPDYFFDADSNSSLQLIAALNKLKPADRKKILRVAEEWGTYDKTASPK